MPPLPPFSPPFSPPLAPAPSCPSRVNDKNSSTPGKKTKINACISRHVEQHNGGDVELVIRELVEVDDEHCDDEVRMDTWPQALPTYGESMPLGTELILAICRVYYRLEQDL